jgi:hypothetical protein
VTHGVAQLALANAPRLGRAARACGRTDMPCGAQLYVGAQMEFCQDRAAAASTASETAADLNERFRNKLCYAGIRHRVTDRCNEGTDRCHYAARIRGHGGP